MPSRVRSLALIALASCTANAPLAAPPALEVGTSAPFAVRVEHDELVAVNALHGLRARFSAERITFAAVDGELALTTESYGCRDNTERAPSATPRRDGARVVLDRGAVSEWYLPGEAGIEQGFTLARDPGCSAPVVIEMTARGLSPELDGDDVTMRDASGAAVLSYAGLHVEDADGDSLAAWLEVEGSTLRIAFDDGDARYPVVVDPLITTSSARLSASDGATADRFGSAVAVSGDTMVVGANEVGATDAGAAYVFVRSGGVWTQQARLSVTGSLAFGAAVAISGDTIVVGAPYTASFDGAAHVFVRPTGGTTWSLQQTIPGGTDSGLGSGVAIAGDVMVLGAPGSGPDVGQAFVHTRVGTTWSLTDTLAPAGTVGLDMDFGASVAFDGTNIAVGAPFARFAGVATGLAYVFGLSCFGTYDVETELRSTASTANSRFGDSIAVSAGTVLVGSPGHTFFDGRGAAYVFVRGTPVGAPCPTVSWTAQATLTPSDPVNDDHMGRGVALDGNRALISGEGRDTGIGRGYYFLRTGTTWAERTALVPADTGMVFAGVSAALGADFAALGATGAPRSASVPNAGGVYVFDVSRAPNGATCTLAADCASGFCADGVCCNVACGGSATDCQACSVAAGATADGTCTARTAGACDDGSVCTTSDVCGAGGSCGGTAVTCTASGPCVTSACSAATGLCVESPRPDGASCSDGNGCTVGDVCAASVCAPGTPTVCTASDACHVVGLCNPATGACSNPAAPNGTACNDGNACTTVDACAAGTCTGASSVACTASDACHVAGLCSPTTGTCSNPVAPNGTACTDGDACTTSDVCTAGACGGTTMTCTAPVCQTAGTCTAGTCPAPVPVTDGTPCPGGECAGGACIAIDAGPAPDAGAIDAGVDAGEPMDAGEADGGEAMDGGALDTGEAADAGDDAGSVTPLDASLDDAAVSDAGASDAATDDAAMGDVGLDAARPDAAIVPVPLSDGCSCSVPSARRRAPVELLALALGLLAIARRRR